MKGSYEVHIGYPKILLDQIITFAPHISALEAPKKPTRFLSKSQLPKTDKFISQKYFSPKNVFMLKIKFSKTVT